VLRGVNFKEKDGGFFLVVAAKRPNGERVVNYQWGNTMEEAWQQFAYGATHKTGLKWYPDKYSK